jgi:N utilization substance protein B
MGSNYDIARSERELFVSIDKIYELYLSKLAFIIELKHIALRIIEDNKNKLLPTPEDLNPNLSFVNNSLINQLEQSKKLSYLLESKKISWNQHRDIVKKIFLQIAQTPEYTAYMNKPNKTYLDDQNFIVDIFANYIAENELVEFIYEEQSIYWLDDFYLVNTMVIKTIKNFKENHSPDDDSAILNLYKDPVEDKDFVSKLFRYTIVNNDKYQNYIVSKLKNWEPDRIALMDMIIMKMALCELTNFPNIPVKVTLNEYIDLSKDYSTQKSKIFINGILDKLIPELKTNGEIVKVGRGLVE